MVKPKFYSFELNSSKEKSKQCQFRFVLNVIQSENMAIKDTQEFFS